MRLKKIKKKACLKKNKNTFYLPNASNLCKSGGCE